MVSDDSKPKYCLPVFISHVVTMTQGASAGAGACTTTARSAHTAGSACTAGLALQAPWKAQQAQQGEKVILTGNKNDTCKGNMIFQELLGGGVCRKSLVVGLKAKQEGGYVSNIPCKQWVSDVLKGLDLHALHLK